MKTIKFTNQTKLELLLLVLFNFCKLTAYGLVIKVLYNWFIAGLFKTQEISAAQGMGLLIFINFLVVTQVGDVVDRSLNFFQALQTSFAGMVGTCVGVLIVGYLVFKLI